MGTVWQDVRFAARILVKSPGFTLTVVLILTLGIGATTTIFSIVNAVLIQPLPFRQPQRLVQVMRRFDRPESRQSTRRNTSATLCLLEFSEIHKRNHVFESIAALESNDFVDATGEEPRKLLGVCVSWDFFTCLGIQPLLGRGFRAEEGRPGEDRVVVLGYQYWRQRYGADPHVIGKTITFTEGTYTIVGILPARLRFLEYGGISDAFAWRAEESGSKEFSVWKPLAPTPEQEGERSIGRYNASVFARLRSNVTLARAQAELDVIGRELLQQYPRSSARSFPLTPLPERAAAGMRPALWAFLGAVGFVLLIACANVANLLLARSLGRCREVAIRMAIGAGRVRLIRQFLTESLVLSLIGGLCAVLLVIGSLHGIRASMLAKMPRLSEIRVDGWVLGFALCLSLLTGVIIGFIPILHLVGPGVSRTMKEGGFTTRSRSLHGILRSTLLISEVALSLILLTGAGLMVKSFWRLVTVDIGFDARKVLTIGAGFNATLKDRIGQLPGVEGAAFGEPPVWNGGTFEKFNVTGRDISVNDELPEAKFIKISDDYFTILRIPLLMGRLFDAGDHVDAERVAIVNQSIARQYFPDRSPLDQIIGVKGRSLSFRIVGVVGDVRPNGFRSDVMPTVYLPFVQGDKWFRVNNNLIVRARGDLGPALTAVRREFLAMNPLSPPPRLRTLDEQLMEPVRPMRANMQLLSIFAALALVLASVGVYGLMAFSVSQHTQEIGIRMALGARSLDILRSVVGQGLKLTLVGTGIGLVGAFALTRVISSLLYDVSPTDPLTFAFVSLVLIAVAALASYLPARRAARIDPMVALRYE